ncbi:MAG: hypothetical protein V4645_18025 [Pseudomonadota bacterium]
MKTLIALTLLGLSAGALAQTTAGGANNQSQSSATTNAQGNTQAVNFNSSAPSDVTSRATVDSNSTQNINNTGATTSVVDYRGSYTVKNVPSVSGPNLTTSNDTCMGSTSASANGPGVGLSFGTTWTDEHCKRLKMSRELWNKGMKAASLAMDCMDPAAQAALEMTGSKCPQSMTAEERVSAFGPQASSAGAPVAARPAVAAPVAAAPAPVPAPAPVAPVAVVAPAPAPAPVPAPVAVVPQPVAPAPAAPVAAVPVVAPAQEQPAVPSPVTAAPALEAAPLPAPMEPAPAPIAAVPEEGAMATAEPAPVASVTAAPVEAAPQPDILEARITRRLPADATDEVAAAPADAQ